MMDVFDKQDISRSVFDCFMCSLVRRRNVEDEQAAQPSEQRRATGRIDALRPGCSARATRAFSPSSCGRGRRRAAHARSHGSDKVRPPRGLAGLVAEVSCPVQESHGGGPRRRPGSQIPFRQRHRSRGGLMLLCGQSRLHCCCVCKRPTRTWLRRRR